MKLQDDAGEDDFEIVPREPEHVGPDWDINDEDQDEVKRKLIQSGSSTYERNARH